MATLIHGATPRRAEEIAAIGPDLDFVEPGGGPPDEISILLDVGRTDVVGPAEGYAIRQAGIFPGGGGPAVLVVGVPLRKSVFRAVVARVAVLRNERRADSVSPYAGYGEVALDAGAVVSVRFENTSAVQSLGVAHRESNGGGHAGEIGPRPR